ncbi:MULTISPECIES: hypothetical protein [Staphylococcus]|uniref:hypothetical protein n=1 Tax=Staphylococcus TaxID=1279 RepID=UPI00024E4A3F|nr:MULTISPECIES: hypothetical protein [Staphylococcus]MDU4845941.1 hypothetical protein [Streptococcus mitis]EHS00235.1 hypothetical protein SEVCU129_1302 [Staphylococcus epidermidis VCU129]MBC2997343.1 hypothetical protein [Staphylococcus epidermidis]MBC3050801.1 hypothetical protein [Staphylococcus epidermidis]MBC3061947.1 hypothetical protein [Staphylococcus epidermidis]
MEFKLLDKYGKEVVIVKRINLHSYSLKGIKDTPFSNLIMFINPCEIPEYKKQFNLFTQFEYDRKVCSKSKFDYTLLDLLISANFNLNKFNSGNLEEDNKRDSIGKHQLSMAIEFISKGLDLNSPIEFHK